MLHKNCVVEVCRFIFRVQNNVVIKLIKYNFCVKIIYNSRIFATYLHFFQFLKYGKIQFLELFFLLHPDYQISLDILNSLSLCKTWKTYDTLLKFNSRITDKNHIFTSNLIWLRCGFIPFNQRGNKRQILISWEVNEFGLCLPVVRDGQRSVRSDRKFL